MPSGIKYRHLYYVFRRTETANNVERAMDPLKSSWYQIFSSLMALEVVVMTNSSATSDQTLGSQWFSSLIRFPVACSPKEVNPSLAKSPLKSNGGLYKIGLIL